jgi:recombination protein RecT
MAQLTRVDLTNELEGLYDQWMAMLSNPGMAFERELEWCLQSCSKNDYALKYALGNPDSVKRALLNCAGIGVTQDPARKFAYVLPRDNGMVYDLSYMGIIDCAIRDNAILWAQAHRVRENDQFELRGYDQSPLHVYKPFAKPEERGAVVGVYCVVKTPTGDYLTTTMTVEEINAIRARSAAFKQGKGPWKSDEAEMQKKTVVKNGYKYWPRSERMDRAVHYLNTDAGQGVDLAADDAADAPRDVYRKKVEAATTGDELKAILSEGRAALEKLEDVEGYKLLVAQIKARGVALGLQPATNGASAPAQAPAAAPAAAAPAARSTAPKPGTYAHVKAAIEAAEDDAALEAAGALIDALPANEQGEADKHLNTVYNTRLAYLNKKFGRPE